MTLTISIIVMIVAYTSGAIMQAIFTKLPTRFIPIQNVIVGFISGIICYFGKIESNFIVSIVSCMMATLSAGGINHLISSVKEKE